MNMLKNYFFKFSYCHCSSHTRGSSDSLYMKGIPRGKTIVIHSSIKRICTIPFSSLNFKFS